MISGEFSRLYYFRIQTTSKATAIIDSVQKLKTSSAAKLTCYYSYFVNQTKYNGIDVFGLDEEHRYNTGGIVPLVYNIDDASIATIAPISTDGNMLFAIIIPGLTLLALGRYTVELWRAKYKVEEHPVPISWTGLSDEDRSEW